MRISADLVSSSALEARTGHETAMSAYGLATPIVIDCRSVTSRRTRIGSPPVKPRGERTLSRGCAISTIKNSNVPSRYLTSHAVISALASPRSHTETLHPTNRRRGTSNAPGVDRMATDFTPRDDAGREMDYERYRSLLEREAAREQPRDCVTEVPLHGGRTLLLISYDAEGQPGPTSSFPADKVKDGDVIYLLERCREIYRETHPNRLRAV